MVLPTTTRRILTHPTWTGPRKTPNAPVTSWPRRMTRPLRSLKRHPTRCIPLKRRLRGGYDTRAQLASYVGATMATQYHSHFFTVLIAGKRVRFLRWERASAIVTKSFDLTHEPLLLFEFFKRFRQLTLEQRGSNTHVSPATATEASDARKLLQNMAPELWLGAAGYLFLKTNTIDIRTQPFLKLTFEGRTFIIPAPHCPERGLSPFGRASRGTAAVCVDQDTKKRTVCFLKDGWRDTHRISEPEVYKALAENQIRNIANMACGGDLKASTIGHIYRAEKAWVRRGDVNKVRQLQSCIIVLDVVGRPLVAFRKAHQLVGALADAMEAYSDALKKAGIMHRDISPYNILIVNTNTEQKGILIDWDHAIRINPASTKRCLWRTGTWQFMSIALLKKLEGRTYSAGRP
ncbi:hypothetical protein FA13DRAFT_1272666 [Coprinellus micaceus]|uniref:Protein kinase domain-containing protein n=1 Tax=Coprinellus micaceus TaxID=71717 RepID=A0A4Y7ST85_COPMI|nr:hypothetical protein FA13DRAFT_1272666 [Coprinellus micaceus]